MRVARVGIVFLALAPAGCAARATLSHCELTELLGVRRWTVPMPKDERLTWAFELREATAAPVPVRGLDSWMDRARTATVVFMPTGERTNHRFWLRCPEGTSSGTTRIDTCADPHDTTLPCWEPCAVIWLAEPIRIADGARYVIAQLTNPLAPSRKWLLTLYLTTSRVDDMTSDSSAPGTGPQRSATRGDVGLGLR